MTRSQTLSAPRGVVGAGPGPARAARSAGPARGGDASVLVRRRRHEAEDDEDDRHGHGTDRHGGPSGGHGRFDEDAPRPGGLPFRLALAALQNPIPTGATLLVVVAAVAIVSNALSNQTRRHPAPLFETRPYASAPARSASDRTADRTNADRTATRSDVDRTPPRREAAPPAPAAAQPRRDLADSQPRRDLVDADPIATTAAVPRAKPRHDAAGTVERVQAALKDRGLYFGPVDGIPGPATADSIRVFERQMGLPVTGEASDRVLAAAQSPAPRGTAVAVRTTTITPGQPTASGGQGSRGQDGTQGGQGAQGGQSAQGAQGSTMTPPAPLGRSAAPEPLAQNGDERLQRIQRSLLAAGYGPVRTDGRMDERTGEAIRRYELDRGWPMTGKPSDRLALDVMVSAGR